PVFALGGMEGRMSRPLAFTKSFARAAVAVRAVAVVPALCTVFVKGRLRGEMESWLVRGVVRAYRPVLAYCLAHPAPLVWFVGVTLVVELAPLGVRWAFLLALFVALVTSGWAARHALSAAAAVGSLIVISLVADQHVRPLGYETM